MDLLGSSSPKLAQPEVPARRGRGRFEESLEFTGGGAGTALQQVWGCLGLGRNVGPGGSLGDLRFFSEHLREIF